MNFFQMIVILYAERKSRKTIDYPLCYNSGKHFHLVV